MELVEQRGGRWYVRYQDNPDDPWRRVGPFADQAEARDWLREHPAVDVDDDQA